MLVELSETNTEFKHLSLSRDKELRALWCTMRPTDRPSFTLELMREIGDVQEHCATRSSQYDFFVMDSSIPGIFNLGGDLRHFEKMIREKNLQAMKYYGEVAIKAVYRNHVGFEADAITIAFIQGDALGGGFECALSLDVIIAEQGAKFGLPEILFNLFPGMGAYSFLRRKVGRVLAERIITSGKVYSADEMHHLGVVDVLVPAGTGRTAVANYIDRVGQKFNAHRSIIQARRMSDPVSFDELRNIVYLWAESSLNLTDFDLRKMARLASSQDRRFASIAAKELVN